MYRVALYISSDDYSIRFNNYNDAFALSLFLVDLCIGYFDSWEIYLVDLKNREVLKHYDSEIYDGGGIDQIPCDSHN